MVKELDLAVGLSAEENGLGGRKSERERRQITSANIVKAKTAQVKTTLYRHLKNHKLIFFLTFVYMLGVVSLITCDC